LSLKDVSDVDRVGLLMAQVLTAATDMLLGTVEIVGLEMVVVV
jgi:hypothetical protein